MGCAQRVGGGKRCPCRMSRPGSGTRTGELKDVRRAAREAGHMRSIAEGGESDGDHPGVDGEADEANVSGAAFRTHLCRRVVRPAPVAAPVLAAVDELHRQLLVVDRDFLHDQALAAQ